MQIQDKELLLIGLKDHIDELHTSPLGAQLCWWDHENHCYDSELLPGGDYELIGIWPDITEQQAQKAVDIVNDLKDVVPGECYENYVEPDRYTNTALESLSTRMQKAGALMENPEGDKPKMPLSTCFDPLGSPEMDNKLMMEWGKKLAAWQEAEARVFKKWGILKKR